MIQTVVYRMCSDYTVKIKYFARIDSMSDHLNINAWRCIGDGIEFRSNETPHITADAIYSIKFEDLLFTYSYERESNHLTVYSKQGDLSSFALFEIKNISSVLKQAEKSSKYEVFSYL